MKKQFNQKERTVVELSPRFEGSNICTWIGFKHVMYLVEEAVLEHFRASDLSPRMLFEDHGLCLEIVDSDVRILHALHMDDRARVEISPLAPFTGPELCCGVKMFVTRGDKPLKVLTGKVKVLFRKDRDGANIPTTVPGLAPYVVSEISRVNGSGAGGRGFRKERGVAGADDQLIRDIIAQNENSFVWKWHIPYFYCHFTERIQHSGYLRLMEEVVDLFLADRDISIRKMLDTRQWIPVVPQASLEILREGYMEETIYTVYRVENVFKAVTYTARVDCYVERDDCLVHTATGRITHGYAVIEDRRNWSLVNFDDETVRALNGARQ